MILNAGNKIIKPFTGEIATDANFPDDGSYFAIDRRGRDTTWSRPLWNLWYELHLEAQALSTTQPALTSEVTKDLIKAALLAINRSFVAAHRKVRTMANDYFDQVYGGRWHRAFNDMAIRWPGENQTAWEIVMKFAAALHQIPFLQSNVLDNGIPPNHAVIVVQPLYSAKAWLMREFFELEIRGEISNDELEAIFREDAPMPPLDFSMTDTFDTPEETEEEDAGAMEEESGPLPTAETQREAERGVKVWTWVPENRHWTKFGEIIKRMRTDGPRSVPGEPWPFGEQTIGNGASAKKTSSKKTTTK